MTRFDVAAAATLALCAVFGAGLVFALINQQDRTHRRVIPPASRRRESVMWHLHWMHHKNGPVASSTAVPGAPIEIPAGATHVTFSEHALPTAAGHDFGRPAPQGVDLDTAERQVAQFSLSDEQLLADEEADSGPRVQAADAGQPVGDQKVSEAAAPQTVTEPATDVSASQPADAQPGDPGATVTGEPGPGH